MIRFAILFLAIVAECSAATWYVRPGVWSTVDGSGHPNPTAGIYGTQDGSSYANALNGITSLRYGGSGVLSNDVVYICGTHIFTYLPASGGGNNGGLSTVSNSNFTVRGDYPGDPCIWFGGARNLVGAAAAYLGPDANGVYHQTLLSSVTPGNMFYIDANTNITRLKKRTATTWTDGLGGQYLLNQTNYVQIPDGTPPTTNNISMEAKGWGFDLNNQSNITFQSITFISPSPGPGLGAIRVPTTAAPWTTATRSMTFTNCTFKDSSQFYLYPGQDYFSFLNCEFARMSSGIYSLLNSQTQGVSHLTVSGCFIHDTGTTEYNDGDAHAIGLQGGNYNSLTHNVTSNTGPSIVIWTGGVDMKTNTISYNFIVNTHTNTASGTSDGISIGGDNASALQGRRNGNKIYGNIIRNCDVGSNLSYQGFGINVNSPDYTEIYNNTIYGGRVGIDYEVIVANGTVNAKIVNNIILSPSVRYYYLASVSSQTNLTVDYNLYWPSGLPSTVAPTVSHDTHSITNNPVLASATPTTIEDFIPGSTSPVVGHGTSMNLALDIIGTTYPAVPDIGAYQHLPPYQTAPSNGYRSHYYRRKI